MKTIFLNLINGNLEAAKSGAIEYGEGPLKSYASNVLGWSVEKSYLAARYLKGEDCWQDFCDAE